MTETERGPEATWTDGNASTVPVPGGDLAVTRWGTGPGTPVLGIHGITANGYALARLAVELERLGGPPLIAPDLRGRGRSGHLPGPFGLGAHVDDVIAVLDAHDVDRTVLVGHSMGAFVACLAAVRHPDRVTGLLLIDGGHGLPVPPGVDIEDVLGPAMTRLRMSFTSADAYRDFWRGHPAMAGRWNTWVDHYVTRDLTGTPPELRSACSEEAARVDGAQVLTDPETLGAVHRLSRPARLAWAARGLLDESPGLYTPERLAGLPDDLALLELPDDNHYSPMFSSTAVLLAQEIHSLVEQTVQVQGEL
ncbi:alpha/beta fold hydrolase [Nocardiopsis lucentensis]|uniref:alpha/beta fold hydrolase n=1 Tax=Nocardiopsis lucentensis TaxID=53441 RepID=UPI000345396F|nr:alpha/beta hydrolase [Nocardiopsis lucentensis]